MEVNDSATSAQPDFKNPVPMPEKGDGDVANDQDTQPSPDPTDAPEPTSEGADDAKGGESPQGEPTQEAPEQTTETAPEEDFSWDEMPLDRLGLQRNDDGEYVFVDEDAEFGRVVYRGETPDEAIANARTGLLEKQKHIQRLEQKYGTETKQLREEKARLERELGVLTSRIDQGQLDEALQQNYYQEIFDELKSENGLEGIESADEIAEEDKQALFNRLDQKAQLEAYHRVQRDKEKIEEQQEQRAEAYQKRTKQANSWFETSLKPENLGLENTEDVYGFNEALARETGHTYADGEPATYAHLLYELRREEGELAANLALQGLLREFEQSRGRTRRRQPKQKQEETQEERTYNDNTPPPASKPSPNEATDPARPASERLANAFRNQGRRAPQHRR